MVLTQKQKDELDKAILEYLYNNQYEETAKTFEIESNCQLDSSQEKNAFTNNILEKKWIAIIRLQKKIQELEQKVENLTEELNNSSSIKFKNNLQDSDQTQLFPKQPAKYTLNGHRAPITHITFHPQYTIIASSSEDASIKLWDFESGQFERTLKGHTGQINYVSFDLQGKYLASASSDLTVKLWDVLNQFQCVKTFHGHDHSVSSVNFFPNGDYLVSASRDKQLKCWELNTGYCKRTYIGHSEWVRRGIVSDDGQYIASCSNDQKIIIWQTEKEDPHQILIGHEHVVECITFINHDNGKKAVAESQYAKNQQIDIVTSEESKNNGIEALNNTMSTLNNIAQNIGVNENTKALLNKVQQTAQTSKTYQNLLLLVSGSRDKTVRIWNCLQATCLQVLSGHDNWVRGVAIHHGGKFIYTCSDDKSLRIWDLNTGKCTKKIQDAHSHFVSCVASNYKYLSIATGSVDSNIKLWECK